MKWCVVETIWPFGAVIVSRHKTWFGAVWARRGAAGTRVEHLEFIETLNEQLRAMTVRESVEFVDALYKRSLM